MVKAARPLQRRGSIFVLAGCNGAGKSSIGGAALLEAGVRFYNPDEGARKIVERFDGGRRHLVRLLPQLASVRVYDNSVEADPAQGLTPAPRLLLHSVERKIVAPMKLRSLLEDTPQWAKPIVAAALDLHLKRR